MAASSWPAWAHGSRSRNSYEDIGLSIPAISHGQMAVLAAHREAILDLADRQTSTDPTMRRLASFISLQTFACAWGVVPGSLTAESSPFNECTHAYLAATRALLLHLQGMPAARSAALVLARRIDREMIEAGSSLVLCQYSDTPFNTADVIDPQWSDFAGDLPTVLCLLAVMFAAACLGALAASLTPQAVPSSRPSGSAT